jgi:hypothetical protein
MDLGLGGGGVRGVMWRLVLVLAASTVRVLLPVACGWYKDRQQDEL